MKNLVLAYLRRPSGTLGLIIFAAVVFAALFASWLYPGNPWDTVGAPFTPPGDPDTWLGTDHLGRDILAGIVRG